MIKSILQLYKEVCSVYGLEPLPWNNQTEQLVSLCMENNITVPSYTLNTDAKWLKTVCLQLLKLKPNKTEEKPVVHSQSSANSRKQLFQQFKKQQSK